MLVTCSGHFSGGGLAALSRTHPGDHTNDHMAIQEECQPTDRSSIALAID